MVYKWNYSKDKINQAGKKAVKPGAGRKTMHPEIEQLVHEQAMKSRSYKCRLKDGYAMMMKAYTGEIDKSRKQSASKINFIDLTANPPDSN
jgi:hypothetical protein